MAIDLESVRKEMEEYLAQTDVAVFRAFAPRLESSQVYWDITEEPDFRSFLRTAEKAGIKLIVLSKEAFTLDEIDDVREDLEETALSREEKRSLESRIQDLQKYEGFTSRLELSFSLDGCAYVYRLEADWCGAWDDIMAEIEANSESEEPDGDSIAGYFSAN